MTFWRRSKSFFFILLVAELGCSSLRKQALNRPLEPLHSGDLVFLDLDCGSICDAIENVTLQQFNVYEPRLSHIGIIDRDEKDELWVVESLPSGVQRNPLSQVLKRVEAGENKIGGYYFGRFKPQHRAAAVKALKKIERAIGKPYDNEFMWNNGSYYCSELIALGFSEWFTPQPMFFGKENSPERVVWTKYYKDLKSQVPVNAPGISPLGIYLEGRSHYFMN